MEPRPPFHHSSNNNNRYDPIPPPRFSDHRNFPHHHHHYHHHRLPPPQPAVPPPPPHPRPQPPAPPFRHLPQFPYPFEEKVRRHDALDLHHHPPTPIPRVYDQPVFDHPHRLCQHPDVFDPPTIPEDNRSLRPFSVDWEIESDQRHRPRRHHHHNHRRCHNHQYQHDDGGFLQQERFVEDPESRLIPFGECSRESFERNQPDELFWGPIDRRVDGGTENYLRRPVVTVDHRDESESGYDFEYDVVSEERRRDQNRLPSVSHHSGVMEYEGVVSDDVGPSDDGHHVFSRKRYRRQMKIGKINDIVGDEGSEEAIFTPKKKIQRMSALLRVQLGNRGNKWKDEGSTLPGYVNTKKWKDEGSFASSGYFDNRNAGSSKGKEEVRDGSPVELDVSFKSNALVAKAITNSSSPIVGSDGCGTLNGKKWKVMSPVVDFGSPKLSETHEGKINGDNPTQSMDCKPKLYGGIISLKEKVTVGGNSTMDVVVSKPTLKNMNVPHGNKKKVVKSSANNTAGLGPSITKKKKKVVPMSGTGLQKSQVTKVSEGVVNGSSSLCDVNATSTTKNFLKKAKGKIDANRIRKEDKAGVQASRTAVALPKKSTAVGASPSGRTLDGNSASNFTQSNSSALISSLSGTSVSVDLGRTFNISVSNPHVDAALGSNKGLMNTKMEVTESDSGKKDNVDLQSLHVVTFPLENSASKVTQSNVSAPISSLSNTIVVGNLGGTSNISVSSPCVDTALGSNKGLMNIKMEVTESGIGKKDNVDLQPLHDVTVPHENCAIAGSFSSPIVISDTPNIQIKEVLDEAANADGSIHGASAASNSKEVHRNTKEEDHILVSNRMTKGACLKPIDKTNMKIKIRTGVESLSLSGIRSPAVLNDKRKKKKKKRQINKKKVLDDPSILSSSTVKPTVKGPVTGHVSTPGVLSMVSSDVCVVQSVEKVAASMIGKTGDVDPNSFNGVVVSLMNNEKGQSLQSPASGFYGTPNINNSNEATDNLTDLSNSRLTEICDGTACAGGYSSDGCMIQSGDKVTASEINMTGSFDLQPLHRTAASTTNNATAELLPTPVVDCNDTPEIKKQDCMGRVSLTSIVSQIYDQGMDSAITLEKDFTLSNEKSSSQPLPTAPSLLENSAVELSLLDFNLGSHQKYIPKAKVKDDNLTSILCLSSSQSTLIHDEPLKVNSSDFGTSAGSSSQVCLMQLEEKAKVTGIDIQGDISLEPANLFSSYVENCTEEGSSMFMVLGKDGLNQHDVRNSPNQSTDSNSSVGELAFPILSSPLTSPGLGGGWRKDFDSIVTMGKSKENNLHNENIKLENDKERGGKLMIEKTSENRPFNGEKCYNIGLHRQAEENLGLIPSEAPKLMEDQRSPSKPLENEGYDPPSQDELPNLFNYTPLNVEVSSALLHNSSEEGIELLPDKCTNFGDQESLFRSPESDTLNSEQLHNFLPGKKMSCKEDGLHEKPVDKKHAKSLTSDSDASEKIHEAIKIGGTIPGKAESLPPQESGKSSPFLKTKVGEFTGRKMHQFPQVPRVLLGRSTFAAKFSKKPAALTRITRPRTWRRADNTNLPLQESSFSTGSSKSNPQTFGNTQSNSYIRKGNSLVRKSSPSTILPHGQLRLDPTSRLESKRDDATEINSNSVDPSLRICWERSRTPPLPEISRSPNNTANSSQVYSSYTSANPLVKADLEITPAPVVTVRNVVPKISGASDSQSDIVNSLGTDNILNSGKLKSPKARKVIYVKHKSNQLVASRNTETGSSLLSVSENSQALFSSSSSDQYYKRRKNQLIRSSPSLGSHLKQAVTVPDDGSNSESQIVPKFSSVKCSKKISKRRINKVLVKRCKPSKFSLVWTLDAQKSQDGAAKSLQYQKVLPHLFPWKRTVHWRNLMSNSMSVSKKTSMSMISKKLLLSRKRDTIYTRSAGGFSLRKSKVLSIGGSNLKWSKSIERRSKEVNEEVTRAVAAVQRKKREENGAACAVSNEENINQSSRERIFRIGSGRYKMDSSKRTLQRIPDEKSACSAELQSESGKDGKKLFIPKRLLIGNDEYIRIGNGNQLIRDPKKLVRILASEKVRWSLHTARMRLAKKQQYCQFFTRFGKCKKVGGKCPYIHDPTKVAVCTKFLKGLCSNTDCKLTHEIIPERMQDCSYFLQGLCSNENCPYRHVKVNPKASVCEGFLRGYCADGNECRKKHTYVCPAFESTGICPQGSLCKLHHPKPKNKSKKRKRSKDPKKGSGRYFGSRLNDIGGRPIVASDNANEQKSEGIFVHEGRFADYISLDVIMEEAEDITNNATDLDPKFCESDPSDLHADERIKPIKIMKQGKYTCPSNFDYPLLL